MYDLQSSMPRAGANCRLSLPHDFEKNQYCINNYSHMYTYTAVKMAFLKNLTLESTDF